MKTTVVETLTSPHGTWGGVFGQLGTRTDEHACVYDACQVMAEIIELKNDSGQYDTLIADLRECPKDSSFYFVTYDGYTYNAVQADS